MSLKLISLATVGLAVLLVCDARPYRHGKRSVPEKAVSAAPAPAKKLTKPQIVGDEPHRPKSLTNRIFLHSMNPSWDQTRADIKEAKKIVSSLLLTGMEPYWLMLGELKKEGDVQSANVIIRKRGRPSLICRVSYTTNGKPALKGEPSCHMSKWVRNKVPMPLSKWTKHKNE